MEQQHLLLFGQAFGDGLGHFIFQRPQLGPKIYRTFRKQIPAQFHLGYGEHVQLGLLLNNVYLNIEKPYYEPQFSSSLTPCLQDFPATYIRSSYHILPRLKSGTVNTQEDLSAALLFTSLSVHFQGLDRLAPWLLGFASQLNRNHYSIAGTIFLGLYLHHRKNNSNIEDFIATFQQWRKSSQALQSPIPDQVYWAFQQALWIAIHYNRRHMLEFVGQDQGVTITTPNAHCALSMIPYAIALADKMTFEELVLFVCDPSLVISKSDLVILGMLCGLIIGSHQKSLPSWLQIYNQELLLDPKKWKPISEKTSTSNVIHFPPTPKEPQEQLKLF